MNWIPIEDTLPVEQQFVIVYIPTWSTPITVGEYREFYEGRHRWAVLGCIGSIDDISYEAGVTHWMPLPPPPND